MSAFLSIVQMLDESLDTTNLYVESQSKANPVCDYSYTIIVLHWTGLALNRETRLTFRGDQYGGNASL